VTSIPVKYRYEFKLEKLVTNLRKKTAITAPVVKMTFVQLNFHGEEPIMTGTTAMLLIR
jgi:hypothetical protein